MHPIHKHRCAIHPLALLGLSMALLNPCAAHAEAVASPPSDVNQAVRRALDRDPELAAMHADHEGAKDAVRVASAGLWPSARIDVQSGRAIRRDRPEPLFSARPRQPLVSQQTTLTVEQVLYDGQRTRHEISAAELRVGQYAIRGCRVSNERALAVWQSWYAWLGAAQALQAHQQAAQEGAALLERVRLRLQAGQATETELQRAESRWLDMQRAIDEARGRLQTQGLRLRVLIGSDLPAPDETNSAPFVAPEASLIAGWREACESRCPDILEAALQRDRGRAELAAARAAWRPRVALEWSRAEVRNPQGADERYRHQGLMLTARWTLLDGGARSAEIDQIGHSVQALDFRLEDMQRDSLRRFDEAQIGLQTAIAQHAIAQRQLALAQNGWQLTRLGMTAGRRSATDGLDSLIALALAQADLAQQDAARRSALGQLQAAAGLLVDQLGVAGGWAP